MKFIILILLLFIAIKSSFGETFGGSFQDFGGGGFANMVFTSTTDFDGNLGASNVTVQSALDELDELASSGGSSCWELDSNSDLQPVSASCTDTLWELDGDSNLEPKT